MIDLEFLMKALALLLSLVVILVAVCAGYPYLVLSMISVVKPLIDKL